jgi:hypothetical protein
MITCSDEVAAPHDGRQADDDPGADLINQPFSRESFRTNFSP